VLTYSFFDLNHLNIANSPRYHGFYHLNTAHSPKYNDFYHLNTANSPKYHVFCYLNTANSPKYTDLCHVHTAHSPKYHDFCYLNTANSPRHHDLYQFMYILTICSYIYITCTHSEHLCYLNVHEYVYTFIWGMLPSQHHKLYSPTYPDCDHNTTNYIISRSPTTWKKITWILYVRVCESVQ